jgi:hypothetical protein
MGSLRIEQVARMSLEVDHPDRNALALEQIILHDVVDVLKWSWVELAVQTYASDPAWV